MADYSLPAWVNKDPAALINQAIQSSRASRDREQQQMFNQNIDSNKEDRDQQEFDQKQQAGARKVAALQKFTTGIKSIPDTDPQAAQKKQSLLMQYAAESGEFTPGIASMFKAAQPAPTFQPLTAPGGDQSSPAPTAPTMPSAAPLQPPSMSLEAPPATPAPAVPTPAPATTPAPAPAQSFAHPAGFLGSKYIPAQFPQKQSSPPRDYSAEADRREKYGLELQNRREKEASESADRRESLALEEREFNSMHDELKAYEADEKAAAKAVDAAGTAKIESKDWKDARTAATNQRQKIDAWIQKHQNGEKRGLAATTSAPSTPAPATAAPAPAAPPAMEMPKGFKILERNGKSVEKPETPTPPAPASPVLNPGLPGGTPFANRPPPAAQPGPASDPIRAAQLARSLLVPPHSNAAPPVPSLNQLSTGQIEDQIFKIISKEQGKKISKDKSPLNPFGTDVDIGKAYAVLYDLPPDKFKQLKPILDELVARNPTWADR